MARLSTEKFERLKKAFAEQAMTPGQAAPAVGVTYVTAKRWYEKWGDDIKRSLESRLLPTLNNNSAVKVRLRYGPLHPYICSPYMLAASILDAFWMTHLHYCQRTTASENWFLRPAGTIWRRIGNVISGSMARL